MPQPQQDETAAVPLWLGTHPFSVKVGAGEVRAALRKTWRWAEQHDLLWLDSGHGFGNTLRRMSLHSPWKYTIVGIDFAPHSFNFTMCGMYGGMIYHGPHDGGGDGGAPTYSMNLSPIAGWSLHT